MSSYTRVLLTFLTLYSILLSITFIFWFQDRLIPQAITLRKDLSSGIHDETSNGKQHIAEDLYENILVNETSLVKFTKDGSGDYLDIQTNWTEYSENWSGDCLVEKGTKDYQLTFTDEYRLAMISKGLHPLNIKHKYLHERYLKMDRYCNTHLTKLSDPYNVEGSYYRARVSDTFQLLQCALLKVASTTWIDLLRQLEGLPKERYPYPTLWHNLSLKYSIDNTELTAMRFQTYTKFLIVRHPFSRLFSAYKDKFVDRFIYGASYAYQIIHINYLSNMTKQFINRMRQALKRGGNKQTSGLSDSVITQLRRLDAKEGKFNFTFLEFLNFFISQKDPNRYEGNDDHFNPVNTVCNPCAIRYDIIMKYETIQNDSDLILDYVKTLHDHKVSFPKSTSTTSSDSCNNAYRDIPQTVIKSLYEIYKEDFLIFGYEYGEEGDKFC